MLNQLTRFKFSALLLVLCTFAFTSCKDVDDNFPTPFKDVKVYEIQSVADPNIEGTATFAKLNDGTTSITIQLSGTPADGRHPAHIHGNTAVEGGGIEISLQPVNGATGRSVTIVRETDAGTPVSYEDLLQYDGYINVHLSEDNLATIVAQGDIGQNELTGESKEYILEERAVPGINGTVLFEERKNGEALATIALTGTPDGGDHPAHIHQNSAEVGGGIVYTFNPVNGTTGMSKSNVAMLDDGTPFGYDDVLTYDGYVNVHLSAADLATIVAQGNIGSNAY
ncbi:CHRD domain-containing protein [Pontibacter pamirensis]|uniref:CHRD domain-containing protein n=1 Tax=Pontibacter pamirensis TaxID=2562824 RepID=UPI00192E3F9C|nr:CHRD domain-containing protein [Pontibacter pamirensis]